MFPLKPRSQNFCDPELWEAGWTLPCDSQNLPAPGSIPALTLDPKQAGLLGLNTIFRGTKG